ncbi:MAG: methionine synthase [Anaerolineaceae bacterium]|nr:methionine synthase [Anaerolineaceae bacterium]
MKNELFTNRKYLDALKDKILVFDGAMGTSIQVQNLTPENYGGENLFGCIDYLSISFPQAVEKVSRSFLEAGADVIETNSFRSNRLTLAEYGLQHEVHEINKAAASLARRLADEFSTADQPRFVAGSIGPSGKLPSMNDPELSDITFLELLEVFCEQAIGLIAGGADLLLIETSQDILEVKAAIQGIHQAFEKTGIIIPIQAQVTLDITGRMLLGTDIGAALIILEEMGIDTIGLNCSTGPDHMREPIQYLGEYSSLPVSCIPNAGLPLNVDGEAVYPLEPEPFADALSEFVEKYNVNIVGGCCGTTPLHIKRLSDAVQGFKPRKRKKGNLAILTSAVQAKPMQQEPAPFLIGERLNTQGSRKFKRIILENNLDEVYAIAQQQVDSGAHGLDICVALTEVAEEAETMRSVIKTLAPTINLPLIIDSTELDVIEIALQNAPGKCLINSTNLEAGREKADKIFAMAKKYNAAVIALTIDQKGMAKTADRKLEIAKIIYEIAVHDHGLRPQDLVFDALTFTLATGDSEFDQSAVETIEGIRRIKQELPGVLTSLGVSNISFGLNPAARKALNSIMLYHCVKAGMDMAIVNPSQITPYSEIPENIRKIAEDLIFFKHPAALQNLIEHFKDVKDKDTSGKSAREELNKKPPRERVFLKILKRIHEDIEKDLEEIIHSSLIENRNDAAVEILNEVLLPAMKEVGDKFGSGELILPFVLQSAEVMKKAVTHLEQYLEHKEGVSKGKVVLATVYGDVHDIGKNLVKTILVNNGYQVVDLGKQVPAETIISKAIEEDANAIGLSALLVSTSKQMPLIINELNRRKLDFPVLIGGAAINKRFGRRILMTDNQSLYPSGVFYCKDAFDGLSTMDKLMNAETRRQLLEVNQNEARIEMGLPTSSKNPKSIQRPSTIQPAESIPDFPKWGYHFVNQMPFDAVFDCISKRELFRLSWGAKNTRGEAWKKLEQEFEEKLESMRQQALKEKWLSPKGLYGFWPTQSDGDDLIIYAPESINLSKPKELSRMNFPRQKSGEFLCLSDYFSSVSSGKMDIVAFQIVTVGLQATERFDALQNSGNYSEAYFTHGFAVQMAEASAEYLHRHIRKELGMSVEQGKRYSWGFPAIPELKDHKKVFSLLPAEEILGMKLTDAFQLVPEQSTAAIILHHPSAKYYSVGESRLEQLLK